MELEFLDSQQLEMTFRFSDIMSMGDLTIAASVLASYDWNIEKAIGQLKFGNQANSHPPPIPKPSSPAKNPYLQQIDSNPYHIQDEEEEEQAYEEDNNYEYQNKLIEEKKKMFEEDYASLLTLKKTLSQPSKQFSILEYHKLLAKDSKAHRQQYFSTLMNKSEAICKDILQSDPQKKKKFNENNKKIENNRKFINFLYTNYLPRINFTFGTFFLNLTRSYLEGKYLLVYIHSIAPETQKKYKKVIELIFRQKQIAKFVNENCITYGMFDNSDDYQFIQKYVPLKDLPAFTLFKLNKNKRAEEFISVYKVTGESQIFLQWLASSMGIFLKKKEQSGEFVQKQKQLKKQIEKLEQEKKKKMEEEQRQRQQYNAHTYIKAQQDQLWQEMERTYQQKRLISQQKKDEIYQNQESLQKRIQLASKDIQPEEGQNTIYIRFRMPNTGDSKSRRFLISDKVQKLFNYVDCFCRGQFEEKFNDFDLKQTFPPLSLNNFKDKLINEVFEGSQRENIIVRQL